MDSRTFLGSEINSGDDDGCPTARHNEARMLICEELPELQDSLLYRGQTLARYLAARPWSYAYGMSRHRGPYVAIYMTI